MYTNQHLAVKQKVAIVTGGSRGIGRRIVERLAQENHKVVIGYRSGVSEAEAVVGAIEKAGGTALAVQVDVADESAVVQLFDVAERTFGGVDVVVHAAGVMITRPLVDFTVHEIDAVIRTNLFGALLINRQAVGHVRPGGAIINISSAVTRGSAQGYSVYAATKAALEAVTRTLALELRGRDVTINAVAPGPTETEMLSNELAKADGEQLRAFVISSTPLGRFGRPDDIAEVVLALVGPLRWVHGQVIHASGGMV